MRVVSLKRCQCLNRGHPCGGRGGCSGDGRLVIHEGMNQINIMRVTEPCFSLLEREVTNMEREMDGITPEYPPIRGISMNLKIYIYILFVLYLQIYNLYYMIYICSIYLYIHICIYLHMSIYLHL